MQRWIRLAWIGLANTSLLLAPAYFSFPVFPHGRPWYAAFSLFVAYWWDLIFGAILGFVLEAVQAKRARLVNIGLWVWVAVKSTAVYFSLWGSFSGAKWLAAYVPPTAWALATVDFFLYRKRSELQRKTT
jgi:hypothetical protein